MHVIVSGVSGSGKTYLARYFRERGVNAYDGDAVPGLARWIDRRGREVEYVHSRVDRGWLSKNFWVWNERKLKSMLKHDSELFLFGVPHNLYDLVPLFDKAYWLHAGRRTISRRLRSAERDNPYGKNDEQRKAILSWIDYADKTARMAGLEFVDASLPPGRIMKMICGAGTGPERGRA